MRSDLRPFCPKLGYLSEIRGKYGTGPLITVLLLFILCFLAYRWQLLPPSPPWLFAFTAYRYISLLRLMFIITILIRHVFLNY